MWLWVYTQSLSLAGRFLRLVKTSPKREYYVDDLSDEGGEGDTIKCHVTHVMSSPMSEHSHLNLSALFLCLDLRHVCLSVRSKITKSEVKV